MSNNSNNQLLVLIVTYRCNLRCLYCPTVKKEESMGWDTAKRSIDLFISFKEKSRQIKFFGGEPLLEFGLIKKIVEYNKIIKNDLVYELTTNGLLLDEENIKFFKDNNFELRISIDGDRKTQTQSRGENSFEIFNKLNEHEKRYVIANIVCPPSQAYQFYENFIFLHENGFRKFNILPAFFNDWSEDQISNFNQNLMKIAGFIRNKNVYIKNVDINNKSYLFNDGYIIDCNGDIFGDNKVLAGTYQRYRDLLKLGNINDIKSLADLSTKYPEIPLDKSHLTNMMLDNCITNFVNELR